MADASGSNGGNIGYDILNNVAQESTSGLGGLFWGEQRAKRNYARQLDMMNRVNAYNSPANQVRLLDAGGLNRALMYSSGGSDSTASAPAVPENDGRGGNIANPMMMTQAELMRAQTENLIADSRLKNVEADTKEKGQQTTLDIQSANLSRIGAEIDNIRARTNLNEIELDLKEATFDSDVDRAILATRRLNLEVNNLEFEKSLQPLQRQQLEYENARITAETARAFAQSQLYGAERQLVLNQTAIVMNELANWETSFRSRINLERSQVYSNRATARHKLAGAAAIAAETSFFTDDTSAAQRVYDRKFEEFVKKYPHVDPYNWRSQQAMKPTLSEIGQEALNSLEETIKRNARFTGGVSGN